MKKAKIVKKNKKEEEKKVETISIKNSIIVVLMMLLVLVGFYFLTEKLLEKQAKEVEEINTINVRKTNDINYSDIDDIVSDSYYLLLSKDDDKNNDEYDKYINTLTQYNFEYSFYYVDLSKKANKDLYDEEEEKLKELDDIQVKDTTLIFVSDGKIKDSYVGNEDILEHLSSFFKIETDTEDDSEDPKDDEKKDEEEEK